MHMVRQNDPGIDMERMARVCGTNRFAQQIDMADQHVASTVEQIDRKEIRGTRHLGAAVSRHGGSSLSVVLAAGLYRWISKALSTLHHRTHIIRRRIGT